MKSVVQKYKGAEGAACLGGAFILMELCPVEGENGKLERGLIDLVKK